jgi:hypothetical protein
MLLFSRTITLSGSPRRAVPWALAMTEYVNAHVDVDVSLWSYDFGQPLGTVAWSAIIESQAAFAAATAGLLADDGYFDLIDQAADITPTPGVDRLRQLVHGEPTGPAPMGAVATLTTATAMVDRLVAAVGWSVEIAQHITEVTGAPIAVLTSSFGQMGEIAWIGVQPDLVSAAAVGEKLAADPGYVSRMPATKDLFIQGSGHTAQLTRIG